MAVTWDEVKVGDVLPPYVHEAVTRTDLVRYAGASGDYNPMHHDETLATRAGMPSVFAHGMYSMGLLSNVVANWAGIASLVRYEVQFRAITWPADKITCTGAVTGKRSEGDRRLVDVALTCETKPGMRTILGSATVVLP